MTDEPRTAAPVQVIPDFVPGGSPAATFLVTDDGQITHWNSAMAELLGLTAAEALGQPCWLVLAGRAPGGEPICSPYCTLLRNVVAGVGAPQIDMKVSVANEHGTGTRRSTVALRHVGVLTRQTARTMVIHLVDDVEMRRRRERVGERLEALLSENGELPPLTGREADAFRLLAAGYDVAEIAAKLGIAPGTADNNIRRAATRLGARNRVAAVVRLLGGESI